MTSTVVAVNGIDGCALYINGMLQSEHFTNGENNIINALGHSVLNAEADEKWFAQTAGNYPLRLDDCVLKTSLDTHPGVSNQVKHALDLAAQAQQLADTINGHDCEFEDIAFAEAATSVAASAAHKLIVVTVGNGGDSALYLDSTQIIAADPIDDSGNLLMGIAKKLSVILKTEISTIALNEPDQEWNWDEIKSLLIANGFILGPLSKL